MPIYYKFLSADIALKVMELKQLKVSLLSELNDAFDCSPRIKPPSDEPGYTEDTWTDRIIAQNSRHTGLLCFSKTYKSPLLWGHYSSCGTGLALGFDPKEFPWGNPMELRYESSRPYFKWATDSKINHDFVDRMLRHSFGVKATEWRYEEEIRYILALNSCKPVAGMYFAPFPPAALKQVIIGPKVKLTADYINHFVSHHFKGSTVEVCIANLHQTRFEMRIVKDGS